MQIFRKGYEVVAQMKQVLEEKGNLRAYAEKLAREAQVNEFGAQLCDVFFTDGGFRIGATRAVTTRGDERLLQALDGALQKVRAAEKQVATISHWIPLINEEDWIGLDAEDLVLLKAGE